MLMPFIAPGSPGILPVTADLEIYHRADLGVTKDGSDNVSDWAGQLGTSHDVDDGSTASRQPLWKDSQVNGKPSIEFDGTNEYLSKTSITSIPQPFHFFMCIKRVAWSGNDRDIHFTSGNTGMIYQGGSTPRFRQNAGSDANTNDITGLSVGTFGVIQSFFNGASSFQVLDNGSQVSGGNPGTDAIDALYYGAKFDGTQIGNISLAEVAVYSAGS